MQFTRLKILLCVLAAGCGGFSAPAVVSSNAPNFFVRVWPVEKGLPQNKVTCVVQTHDGYLWVGTYSGLARFDGMAFTVFDGKNTPAMHSSRVTALFESDDGTLWIGHENGAVTTFKGGIFRAEKNSQSSHSGKIYAITADESGDVWLLGESGLLVRSRDGLTRSPPPGQALGLLSMTRAIDGTIWVARDGKLSTLRHGELQVVPFGPAMTNTYVQGICAAHDGKVWIANDGRIRKWDGEKWTQ
ncbi:MAG: hypothetical protein JF609_11715, partial [Verrucomicrobia bacterium]|nr:hypothetical protein [Verrucomicrobiota bacterium]